MRKVLIILSSFTLVVTILIAWVMLDGYRIYRFRTSQDDISVTDVDMTGLKELNLSGSNQIVFRNLHQKLENIKLPIYILDLSYDSSGYIGEFTAAFFGYPDSSKLQHYIRRLLILRRLSLYESDIKPESQVTATYDFHYFHLPFKSRTIPSNDFVENFIKIIDNIPSPAWIHTYCQSGRGRTSLAMVMVDILKNSTQVSCRDIMKRQYLLGSQNIDDTSLWRNGTYTQEMLNNRKTFILDFCHFARQRSTGIHSWSEWKKAEHLPGGR